MGGAITVRPAGISRRYGTTIGQDPDVSRALIGLSRRTSRTGHGLPFIGGPRPTLVTDHRRPPVTGHRSPSTTDHGSPS